MFRPGSWGIQKEEDFSVASAWTDSWTLSLGVSLTPKCFLSPVGIRGLVGIGETQASPFCVPRKTPEKLLGRLGFRLSKWKDRCVCLRQPLTPSLSTLTGGLEPRHFIQIIKNFQCLVISYFNSVVSITKVFTKRPNDCIHLTRLPLQPSCVLSVGNSHH